MRRTRFRRASFLAATAVLGVAMTAGSAAAGPARAPSPVQPAVVEQSAAEAIATDLALIAKARGWTVEQARADRAVTELLGRAQEELAARMPEAYVGGVLSKTPGGTPTLLIKGKANAFVHDVVARAGIPIKVADGQPFSFTELEARSMKVHRQLAALGYKDIATGVDIESATVMATVSTRQGLHPSVAGLSAALPAELRAGTQLDMVDGPVGSDHLAFGGMQVRDDGVFICTSGWSVVNGSGTTGVTTAGHCPTGINQITDLTPNPDLTHVLTFQQEHRGSFGDVQWHTAPSSTEPDDFYADATTVRDVSAVEARANISVGEAVCMYGRASNFQDCSMGVLQTSVSCTIDGVSNNRLVAMGNAATVTGGDSGGPWFVGNTAYGSSKGICTVNGFSRAMWSVADLYDEALGVSVRTS